MRPNSLLLINQSLKKVDLDDWDVLAKWPKDKVEELVKSLIEIEENPKQ